MILFHTLIPQDELEFTRQALEKEQLHSPGPASRAEWGPRGEAGVQLGEVSCRPGGNRRPKRELLSRGLVLFSWELHLESRPARLVPSPSLCSPPKGPAQVRFTGLSHRSQE